MDKSKWGAHEGHCCVLHGCKYGDEDCPVVTKETKQKYLCECCDDDNIKSLNELQMLVDIDIKDVAVRFFNLIDLWEGYAEILREDDEYIKLKVKLLNYINIKSR